MTSGKDNVYVVTFGTLHTKCYVSEKKGQVNLSNPRRGNSRRIGATDVRVGYTYTPVAA